MGEVETELIKSSNWIGWFMGALVGTALAPSTIKWLWALIKWRRSDRHWITGEWHLYYFNFEEMAPSFFHEEWLIRRGLFGFSIDSIAIAAAQPQDRLTYKGEFIEEKKFILFHLKAQTKGQREQVFLRFETGYVKPKKHYMIGVSSAQDWDGDASVHAAVLSKVQLSEAEVRAKLTDYLIVSDSFAMKIHRRR